MDFLKIDSQSTIINIMSNNGKPKIIQVGKYKHITLYWLYYKYRKENMYLVVQINDKLEYLFVNDLNILCFVDNECRRIYFFHNSDYVWELDLETMKIIKIEFRKIRINLGNSLSKLDLNLQTHWIK